MTHDELRQTAAVAFAQSIYASASMRSGLTEAVAEKIAREAVLLADKLVERLYAEGGKP